MEYNQPMPTITIEPHSNGVVVYVNCKDGVRRVFNDIGYGATGGDDGHETLVSWITKYFQDNEVKNA